MTHSALRQITITSLLLGMPLLGCNTDPKEKDLAPEAAELKADEKSVESQAFELKKDSAKVTFQMDAELEEITGRAPKSASGSLNVDLMDLSKSTGLVKIDLSALTIFHRKRKGADEEFGEEVMSDKQNEHMRTWLEIAEDAPKEQREKNRFAEFKIESVQTKAPVNVAELKGNERTVSAEASGSIRLHGRVSKQTLSVDLTFTYKGDTPTSVRIVTKSPLEVSLEKHDVRPRTAFNVLADKTLDAMGAKVAKIAKVSLDVTASAK